MTKLTKFEAALRAKFKTPQDALRCLGLDESLLDGENNDNRSKPMARFTARDQAMTVDDLIAAIESLSEEERLELKSRLMGEGAGEGEVEDRRVSRGTGRDRRGARDEPEPFSGRPRPGGSMDPLDRDREDAQDRRRRLAGDSSIAYEDWARRYPDAARVKVV